MKFIEKILKDYVTNYLTEIMKQVEKIWQKQKEANLEIGLWQDGEK